MSALDQPVRRKIYALLAERGDWTTRDDAAGALSLGRSVAAFHLDKLAAAGVVEVSFARAPGRTGPGAGRPAKRYRPIAGELSVSVPERRYDLAGGLLAGAIATSIETSTPIEQCLHDVALAAGRAAGASATPDVTELRNPSERLSNLLVDHGYEPEMDAGEFVLSNCPFHRLAEEQRVLVCSMNCDFLTGVVEGLGAPDEFTVKLAPEPGYCCVRIKTT